MTGGNNNQPQLPKGWAWTKLRDIAERINPGFPSGKWERNVKDGVPHLRPMNINIRGEVDLSDVKYVGCQNYNPLLKGDILFNNTNSPKLLGKTTYIKKDTNWAYSNHMTRVRLFPLLDPGFCSYYLHNLFLNGFFQMNCIHHVNQASINTEFLAEKVLIPIPPTFEQRRIVGRVEELFSYLDAGVESLRKVKAQLKRYHQAVLKYAFEGKLTEEWRKTYKDQLEPAQKLLESIKKERIRKEKKQKELLPVDTSNLPELPVSWIWTRIGEISEMIQYGTSEKAEGDSHGIPVLRMGNIQDGMLIFKDLKYFPKDWSPLKDFILEEGDILFNRTNSAELVGKTAVYKEHHPEAVFASYLIRIKTNKKAYHPNVLSCFINSFYGRKYIASVVSQQVGQANVNGTKLSLMPIPLMPYKEQQEINKEIERSFSITDELEKKVGQSLKQSEMLRQSVLKRAFEGKLIPQDPTDEPAEKLLERIREQRVKSKAEIKTEKKRGLGQVELVRYVK